MPDAPHQVAASLLVSLLLLGAFARAELRRPERALLRLQLLGNRLFRATNVVVGLSTAPQRASWFVASYLKKEGYTIIPVNPNETEVLGEKAYPRLEDVPGKIDIVDVFRRSEHVRGIVESAIRVGAKAIWMQEGVVDEAAAEIARNAGLDVVMDRCILKDHSSLKSKFLL